MVEGSTGSDESVDPPGDDLGDEVIGAESAPSTADATEDAEAAPLAERVRQNRPVRKNAQTEAKGEPTARRKSTATATRKRTTPVQFVGQSVDELKKVVWPTGSEVRQYFVVVLVFVLVVIAYVVSLDTAFGALLLKLLG